MSEQYEIDVKMPMFHLAERNLLLRVFRERMSDYYAREKIKQKMPCEVGLSIGRRWNGWRSYRVALRMTLRRGENADALPRRLIRRYRIKLYKGWLVLTVQVRREEPLNNAEVVLAKSLVADMAEELKLFANGDCFMKCGVERLIAKVANEISVEDPTAWTKAYLTRPSYMERPEVRRYYRLYDKNLNHAYPQILLERREEDLIEAPV